MKQRLTYQEIDDDGRISFQPSHRLMADGRDRENKTEKETTKFWVSIISQGASTLLESWIRSCTKCDQNLLNYARFLLSQPWESDNATPVWNVEGQCPILQPNYCDTRNYKAIFSKGVVGRGRRGRRLHSFLWERDALLMFFMLSYSFNVKRSSVSFVPHTLLILALHPWFSAHQNVLKCTHRNMVGRLPPPGPPL